MTELPEKHPEISRKFNAGHFQRKSPSECSFDQAHEQKNACVKGDGGAVGFTSALRRRMVAGPEVTRVISEFENALE
jgi:hypothetical protein